MILYSHFYDFIAKLILVALLVACLFIIRPEYWESLMIAQWGLQAGMAKFLMISFVCILVVPLVWFVYLPWLSPAAAWCYLRFSLKTPVSWEDARQLESLFRPTLKRIHWFPMTELKNLRPEERKPELLRFFDQIKTTPNQ
ncbi:MAG: hypothetical protein IPL27_12590 [Lewinellaceae bacterium]|nr:hypothetical protein [Lewinellaceae bacterium]